MWATLITLKMQKSWENIFNSDAQAVLKKGKPFMKDVERKKILEAIRYVDNVVISIDEDRTVCKTLEQVYKETKFNKVLFCNGGDQFNDTIPEREVCGRLGIELVDGLGQKIQSSSWLLYGNAGSRVFI